MKTTPIIATAIALAATFTLCQGQTEVNPRGPWYLQSQSRGDWRFEAYFGMEYEPAFAASDDYETEPTLDLRALYTGPNGTRYRISLGEVAATFDLNEKLAAQVKLEYEEGRDGEDVAILENFEEVRTTLEGEFSLFYKWGPAYGFAVFQPDLLGRGKGMVYFIGAGRDWMSQDGDLFIGSRIDLSFADADHMMTEFGVSEIDALNSGLEPYTPGDGLKSSTASLFIEYKLNEKWSLFSDLEAEYYFSKATDSSLIKQYGSSTTYEFLLGAGFRF